MTMKLNKIHSFTSGTQTSSKSKVSKKVGKSKKVSMSKLTRKLLKAIHVRLVDGGWGDIDPDYFDPSNKGEEAKFIHGYVGDVLLKVEGDLGKARVGGRLFEEAVELIKGCACHGVGNRLTEMIREFFAHVEGVEGVDPSEVQLPLD